VKVSESLQTTLDLLTATKNEAAVGVLVPALDSPLPAIRRGALRALLGRRSRVGQREVLRRLHDFGRDEQEIIAEKQGCLSHALRAALLADDPQTTCNAFQAALWLREYDLVPAIIGAVEDRHNPHRDEAARTLLELAKLLYTELAGQRDPRSRRDPQLVRRFVVGGLERSFSRYSRHRNKQVVEALAILTTRENATLKKVLGDPHHGSFLVLIDVLTHSENGGVIRLLLAFLEDPFAPLAALHVIAARKDKLFLHHLMAKVGEEPSPKAKQNLKRLNSISWAVGGDRSVLDKLNEPGQCAALAIALASGMKRLEVFKTVSYLLRCGKPAARRVAARALVEFQGAEAHRLAIESLDDQDPGVQAEIVRQLRHRGMPGALQYQIDRLDSPHEVVREAARESLAEFSFPRFLAAFDSLDESVRRRTGALVCKVDPSVGDCLLDELSSRVRSRRLRALKVVEALGQVDQVASGVIALLADEDHVVRVEAAQLLAQSHTAAAAAALRTSLLDKSVLVQQAAERSLLIIRQRQAIESSRQAEKEKAARKLSEATTAGARVNDSKPVSSERRADA